MTRTIVARRLRDLPLAAFLAYLGYSWWVDGLPLERIRLLAWLLVGGILLALRVGRSPLRLLVDWLGVMALLFAYDFLRGGADSVIGGAHVQPQIDADRLLFAGAVPTVWLQEHFYDPDRLRPHDYVAALVYATHFCTIWTVGMVLWVRDRAAFQRLMGMAVVCSLAAFVTYAYFPAAPPWLASQQGALPPTDRLIGSVTADIGLHRAETLLQSGSEWVNVVAAIPSLHAAYPLLLLLFFWNRRGRVVRGLLATYVAAMALTLVYGAEHYVVDILLGWAYAALTHAAWSAATRARARNP